MYKKSNTPDFIGLSGILHYLVLCIYPKLLESQHLVIRYFEWIVRRTLIGEHRSWEQDRRKPEAGASSFHHYLYKMLALNHFNG